MITWADVKRKVEDAGITDSEPVRSFDIFFSLDRGDFTHLKLRQAQERSLDIHSAVRGNVKDWAVVKP